jgi:hypothetical protein
MPFYKVNAGVRLDDKTCTRLLQQGISLEIFTQIVRILKIQTTATDTIFTIDAGTESTAESWKEEIIHDITAIEETTVTAATGDEGAPDPFDIWVKVGQWTKTAGVGTTTIPSLPAAPKGAIFWGSGLVGAAMGTYAEAGGGVLGYSDGTSDRSYGFACRDNQATINANRSIQSKAFHLVDPTGDITGHILEGCTIGFNADSLDMDWTATTNATVGHYFIFGGDDIENVQVKDFELETVSANLEEYTGLGDKYNFGLFLNPFMQGPLPWGNFGSTNAKFGVSAMSGINNNRCWSLDIRNKDNVSPSETNRMARRSRVQSVIGGSNADFQYYGKFKGFTDDGFFINWFNQPENAQDIWSGFFVKGGSWDCGYFYAPSVVSTVRTLLMNKYDLIQGMMNFTIHQGDITFNSSASTVAKLGIGGEDTDGNRGCLTYAGNNNANPSIEATIMLNNKFLRSIDASATASSSTTTGEATISDMDTRGEFTTDYTIADGTARQVSWFTLSA